MLHPCLRTADHSPFSGLVVPLNLSPSLAPSKVMVISPPGVAIVKTTCSPSTLPLMLSLPVCSVSYVPVILTPSCSMVRGPVSLPCGESMVISQVPARLASAAMRQVEKTASVKSTRRNLFMDSTLKLIFDVLQRRTAQRQNGPLGVEGKARPTAWPRAAGRHTRETRLPR